MASGIHEDNPSIPIVWICEAFNLARSSYYTGLNAKIKKNELDETIWKKILKVWEIFPGSGYRKLASRLSYNGKKLLRILNKYRGKDPKIRRQAPLPRRIPNVIKLITLSLLQNPAILARGNWILRHGKNKYRYIIEPTRPYQLWAGDWKELKICLLGVTLYIFVIIDCYSRELMGWELSIIKNSSSAIKAGEKALKKAQSDSFFDPRLLIMHTDQGSAYLAEDTINFWSGHGVVLSTADKGKPTQNPYIESFFSILVRFWLNYHELITVYEARESIIRFFRLYNTEWPHGSLGNLTPVQKMMEYRMMTTAKGASKQKVQAHDHKCRL